MKRIIFGIFAHPDDEAFGPSGTLLKEIDSGADVHLITLTVGDAGTNPDNVPDLGAIREKEWREAGSLIGASSMHFLGYKDGQLDNLSMIEAQNRIFTLVQEISSSYDEDIEIELMSMDTNGISGHIDHIVAGRSASYVFYKLKKIDPRLSRLRLACIPKTQLSEPSTAWLYMDAGRNEYEIGEVVDASEYNEQIITIMRTHHSQRGDGEQHIRERGDQLGISHFIVKS